MFRIGSNAPNPNLRQERLVRQVEDWKLANKLGSQLTEEAVAGDPLGNKFIIIIVIAIIINSNKQSFFGCVNFLCGQK